MRLNRTRALARFLLSGFTAVMAATVLGWPGER